MGRIARMLQERNAIDEEIAAITGRPMTSGHLGDWDASRIFDIELEPSARRSEYRRRLPLCAAAGRLRQYQWYSKRDGVLDATGSERLDFYLVLTGPPSAAASSQGSTRPWRIDAVSV